MTLPANAVRLLSRTRAGEGGCLIWTGAKNGPGYPMAEQDGRTRSARRMLVEQLRGGRPIDGRLVVTSTCGCVDCMAPEHLRVISHAANLARKVASKPLDVRIRMALARRRTAPKLTLARAREIRHAVAAGETRAAVAARMGVSVGMVNQIVRGAAWREYHGGLHG